MWGVGEEGQRSERAGGSGDMKEGCGAVARVYLLGSAPEAA